MNIISFGLKITLTFIYFFFDQLNLWFIISFWFSRLINPQYKIIWNQKDQNHHQINLTDHIPLTITRTMSKRKNFLKQQPSKQDNRSQRKHQLPNCVMYKLLEWSMLTNLIYSNNVWLLITNNSQNSSIILENVRIVMHF